MQALSLRSCCALSLVIGAAAVTFQPAIAAQVVSITDGDTLTVIEGTRQIKIRLANIDAPEKAQPFGERSRQSLAELCFGKDAQYETQDVDRYGRLVATVTCNGTPANRAQIERGFAWVYPKYNRDTTLPELQRAAQASKRGLFSDPTPEPPWEFRRSKITSRH